MIVGKVINLKEGLFILDVCSVFGGKFIYLVILMNNIG